MSLGFVRLTVIPSARFQVPQLSVERETTIGYKGLESTDDARARLGIGRTKFYELLETGAFKSVKIGRRRLIVSESLDQFIDSLAAA